MGLHHCAAGCRCCACCGAADGHGAVHCGRGGLPIAGRSGGYWYHPQVGGPLSSGDNIWRVLDAHVNSTRRTRAAFLPSDAPALLPRELVGIRNVDWPEQLPSVQLP